MNKPIKTVEYRALVPDGHNITDHAFRDFVALFMAKFMPGFPLDFLEHSNGTMPYDDWEVLGPQYSIETTVGSDGGWVHVIVDERGEALAEDMGQDEVLPSGHEYAGAAAFILADEAEEAAREWAEAEVERRLAYPWAHNWAHMPDDRISDEELQRAGFVVGYFRGRRLCGIDGYGYSFEGQHFARLCAIVHAARAGYGWEVDTDNGPRRVLDPDQLSGRGAA